MSSEYLLHPIAADHDDDDDSDSFGVSSGVEMSLGDHHSQNPSHNDQFRSNPDHNLSHANPHHLNDMGICIADNGEMNVDPSLRGFFVINQDNDLMHEYIPKEEYDAAVKAASTALLLQRQNGNGKMKFGQNTAQQSDGHRRNVIRKQMWFGTGANSVSEDTSTSNTNGLSHSHDETDPVVTSLSSSNISNGSGFYCSILIFTRSS